MSDGDCVNERNGFADLPLNASGFLSRHQLGSAGVAGRDEKKAREAEARRGVCTSVCRPDKCERASEAGHKGVDEQNWTSILGTRSTGLAISRQQKVFHRCSQVSQVPLW